MEIIQKAYNVWHKGMIGYGPEIANSPEETEVVYAHTPSKAKSSANDWKDWPLDGYDASFTDLKCRRAKDYDMVMYEGSLIKRFQIQDIEAKKERDKYLNEILDNPHIEYVYIYKRGYYMPNYCGYTDMKHRAGVYPKNEAVEHARITNEIHLERIDIKEHNKMIESEIQVLKTRLI